jgi:hypothetical protein
MTVQIGFSIGSRTVRDPKVKTVYGEGTVSSPGLQVGFGRGLSIGASLESGYEKKGVLGVHDNPATLVVDGIDLVLGYEARVKSIAGFVKAGYGLYRYRQTIRDNPYAAGFEVDQRKSTVVLGAGIKVYPAKFFFVSAEAKYVPLKVRPYDYEVDLGGWRFLGGLGLRLGK